MLNVLSAVGVPLTVFGGAVPELAPEDLPEGASPFNQDCDFNPGAVFTRGGRVNQIVLGNAFVEHLTGSGASVAGAFAPNETPWNTPSNITLNTAGTYASASVNHAGSGGGGFTGYVDASAQAVAGPTGSTTVSFSISPVATVTDYGIFLYSNYAPRQSSAPVPTSPAGWVILPSIAYSLAGTVSPGAATCTLSGSFTSATFGSICGSTVLLPVKSGFTPVTALMSPTSSGAINNGTNLTGTANVVAGMTLFSVIVITNGNGVGGVPNSFNPTSTTDNHGNVWTPILSVFNDQSLGIDGDKFIGAWIYMCVNPAPDTAANYTYTIHGPNAGGSSGGQWNIISVTNLTSLSPGVAYTQILRARNFAFSL
jgi:hypothetical protein